MLKRIYSKRIEQSMTELLKTAHIAQTIQGVQNTVKECKIGID